MDWMRLHPQADRTEPKLASPSLLAHFSEVPDPRINRRKYQELGEVFVIGVCALLCGGESFNDMEDFGEAKQDWFKSFLKLASGIPSHDTFNRVFSAIDPRQFLECF